MARDTAQAGSCVWDIIINHNIYVAYLNISSKMFTSFCRIDVVDRHVSSSAAVVRLCSPTGSCASSASSFATPPNSSRYFSFHASNSVLRSTSFWNTRPISSIPAWSITAVASVVIIVTIPAESEKPINSFFLWFNINSSTSPANSNRSASTKCIGECGADNAATI